MTKFWTTCKPCNGHGEVNPNSLHARKPANMTGEIVDRTSSVCRKCQGCGIKWKVTKQR